MVQKKREKYPTSRDPADLTGKFKTGVQSFIRALARIIHKPDYVGERQRNGVIAEG